MNRNRRGHHPTRPVGLSLQIGYVRLQLGGRVRLNLERVDVRGGDAVDGSQNRDWILLLNGDRVTRAFQVGHHDGGVDAGVGNEHDGVGREEVPAAGPGVLLANGGVGGEAGSFQRQSTSRVRRVGFDDGLDLLRLFAGDGEVREDLSLLLLLHVGDLGGEHVAFVLSLFLLCLVLLAKLIGGASLSGGVVGVETRARFSRHVGAVRHRRGAHQLVRVPLASLVLSERVARRLILLGFARVAHVRLVFQLLEHHAVDSVHAGGGEGGLRLDLARRRFAVVDHRAVADALSVVRDGLARVGFGFGAAQDVFVGVVHHGV